MARHMAALKEFPVFFYGQAYMGSLEPMASALMVRLLGSTGFAVTLGPVLFAAAALFFLTFIAACLVCATRVLDARRFSEGGAA